MKTNSKNQILHCVAISLLAQFFYQAPCLAQAPGGAPIAGGVVVEKRSVFDDRDVEY